MARPTKYTPEMLERAHEFIENFEPTPFEALPMVAGLADYLGVARSTVYDWADHPEKQEFSDIVEKILTKQELMLASGGLMGTYHATIAKLMLAKHGYVEKTETKDTTKKSIDDLTDEELNEFIAERTNPS